MYYPNRQALGEQLATKLNDFANNETIIFCLKKSSLLACVALAAKLHAYIYIPGGCKSGHECKFWSCIGRK